MRKVAVRLKHVHITDIFVKGARAQKIVLKSSYLKI